MNYVPLDIIDGMGIVMTTSDLRKQMVEGASNIPVQMPKNSAKNVADVNAPVGYEITFPKGWDESQGQVGLQGDALFWHGNNNLFPNQFKKLLKKTPRYQIGLQFSAQQLAGLGLQTGGFEVDENGEEIFKCTKNAKWLEYVKRGNFYGNFYNNAVQALKTHYVVYALVSLSKERKIATVTVLPNNRCRLYGDLGNGKVKACVVTDWSRLSGTQIDESVAQFYPVIDTWYDTANTFKNTIAKAKATEYVYVLRMPTDDVIYPLAKHYAIVENGMIDYLNNIVNFKSWVMKNLTTLNQIMYIHRDYLKQRFPLWETWEDNAKAQNESGEKARAAITEAYKKIVTAFQSSNSGIDKSGKMITAPILEDGTLGVKIEKIDQNTFDKQYNEDAAWADGQIDWALQLDISQYGSVDGKNNNGGSAKTQGYNISQLGEWMPEQTLLEIPQFISDVNGYDVECFRVRRATMLTSDAVGAKERGVQNPM